MSEAEKDKGQKEVILSSKEYESLMKRLDELEGMKEKLLRSAADYENAKKRLAREREEFVRFNQERFILDLLPILDNFERALDHAGDIEDSQAKKLLEGIEMVLKQFREVLKAQGIKKLEPVGKPFDPHQQEAVSYVQEPGEEDLVVEEVQSGYMLHDRLLRAAKVKVRTAPAKEEEIT